MTLDLIKKNIKCGMFQEARRLIERENSVYELMNDSNQFVSRKSQLDFSSKQQMNRNNIDQLPLLVMLALLKDEDSAINLSRILLEKGYHLDLCDKNGLCALNYAIALKRIKLIDLFLNSFDFELNKYRDCYDNSFLHYVFAINNNEIIEQFSNIYSKYYEWDPSKFKYIINCDGLSVQDVFEYAQFLNKYKKAPVRRSINSASSATSRSNTVDPNTDKFYMSDSFKMDSNPVSICKFINQIFHSKSTLKSDLVYVRNNTIDNDVLFEKSKHLHLRQKRAHGKIPRNNNNHEFKLNILYQIKSLNKIKHGCSNETVYDSYDENAFKYSSRASQLFSPINNMEHMPKIIDSQMYYNKLSSDEIELTSHHSIPSLNNFNQSSSSWRYDIKKIFSDYSVMSSASYRVSSAVIRAEQAQAAAAAAALLPPGSANNPLLNTEKSITETVGGNSTNRAGSVNTIRSAASTHHSHSNQLNISHDSKSKNSTNQAKLDIFLVPGSLLKSAHKSKESNK